MEKQCVQGRGCESCYSGKETDSYVSGGNTGRPEDTLHEPLAQSRAHGSLQVPEGLNQAWKYEQHWVGEREECPRQRELNVQRLEIRESKACLRNLQGSEIGRKDGK